MGGSRTSKILWTGRHVQAIDLGVPSWDGSTSSALVIWEEDSEKEPLEENSFARSIWKFVMDPSSSTSKTVVPNSI